MLLPGRHANTSNYRYGFQGQELDNEIKGEGNSHNFAYRMHDPRVGRFFSTDPLTKEYPHYSPYSFSGNKVIDHTEREGLEEEFVAAAAGPPGWVYIAGKWIVIGGAAIYTAYTADKLIRNYQGDDDLIFEPVSTLPRTIDPESKPNPEKKPESKPDPKPVFPIVSPETDIDEDDDSEYVYRAMAKDPITGRPRISTSLDPAQTFSKDLGARTADVNPLLNSQGNVELNLSGGGMSATPTPNPLVLPANMQADLASGKRTMFRIKKIHLIANGLLPVEDKPGTHVSVKPTKEVSVETYQENIRNTQSLWEETEKQK